MRVDARTATRLAPRAKALARTAVPAHLRDGFTAAAPKAKLARPLSKATNNSGPLADRNQNQYLPPNVAASGDVQQVRDFITTSNNAAWQPEIDAKAAEIEATKRDLASAQAAPNGHPAQGRIAELERKLEQLETEHAGLIAGRDRQTATAIAKFEGYLKEANGNFSQAVSKYQDYVFYHSGDPVTLEGPVFSQGANDAHPVSMNDISQRGIGDCWLLSSLAAVAKNDPQAIQNMIRDNGDGTYTVTFHREVNDTSLWGRINGLKKDETFEVTVDMRVAGGHVAQGDNNELWPAIIEKAYAQHMQSYGALDGGSPSAALYMLTGKHAPWQFTDQVGAAAIAQYAADNRNMVVDTCNADAAMLAEYDLVGGHAYAVKGIYTDADGKQYLLLYNPWGEGREPKPIPMDLAAKLIPNFYVT